MKEYRFERFSINNNDLATEKMNNLAADGWEPVAGTAIFVNNAYAIWLSREAEQTKKRVYRKLAIEDLPADFANPNETGSDSEK